MGDFLGDVSFLRNAFSYLGWSEAEFPVGIITSTLVLLASGCVCGKYAFKTTHTVLWAIYWTVVGTFRAFRWAIFSKPKPLTNIEELVLQLAHRGQVIEEKNTPILFCENLRIIKDHLDRLVVCVGEKLVDNRLSSSVRSTLYKLHSEKVTSHQAAKKNREDQEILNTLSRSMLAEKGRQLVVSSDTAELLVLRNHQAEKGKA